ncbi:MAG: haloacid dehalogenase-like hydrolase [Prevotella sp.]|nr:haloacid dehalogenase-like hydrolase [Prevotella sp.]
MIKDKVYAFDFDGTLTTRDTFLAFIRHARGNLAFLWGMLLHSPWLVLMKLGFYPNWKAKQRVFAHFFKGMTIDDFNQQCWFFAYDKRSLIRPKAIEAIRQAQMEGSHVLIVSASVENWVGRCIEAALATAPQQPTISSPTGGGREGAPNVQQSTSITFLCTHIEVEDEHLTGRLLGKNCYGVEKVNRIQEALPQREGYELIAYGDSRGDKEMLEYADERHYKPFRR